MEDDEENLTIYSEDLKTVNDVNVHFGSPTRKYAQGEGYDSDNIIQIATITIPRGEKELGGGVTLGEPWTYQAVISRSLTGAGTPFTFIDRIYGSKQDGDDDFYYWSHFAMAYAENENGVSKIPPLS